MGYHGGTSWDTMDMSVKNIEEYRLFPRNQGHKSDLMDVDGLCKQVYCCIGLSVGGYESGHFAIVKWYVKVMWVQPVHISKIFLTMTLTSLILSVARILKCLHSTFLPLPWPPGISKAPSLKPGVAKLTLNDFNSCPDAKQFGCFQAPLSGRTAKDQS